MPNTRGSIKTVKAGAIQVIHQKVDMFREILAVAVHKNQFQLFHRDL